MSEKSPFNKNRWRWGVAVICILGLASVPFGTVFLNNQFNSKHSESLKSSPYFPKGTSEHEVSYVTSNRGDCFFFTGVSVCSDESPMAILENLEKVAETLSHDHPIQNWTVAWAINDSFAVHPIGLNTVYAPQPINISMYGGDVNTGLKGLFAGEECERFHTVLFSTTTRSNTFDYRCY